MNQDNPPSVACPSCGKFQRCQPMEPMKAGIETWLFEINCECGGNHMFSDYYDKYDIIRIDTINERRG